MRPEALDVAIMLVAMVRRVGGKRGAGTRWRFSDKTLRSICQAAFIRERFLEDLQDELAMVGYGLVALPGGFFGMIELSAIDSWPLISGRERLLAEVNALETNDEFEFRNLIAAARREFIDRDPDLEDL